MRTQKSLTTVLIFISVMALWQAEATATTLSYSDIHPSTLTDWGPFSYNDIRQFNPSVGTFNTVGITLRGSMTSNLTLSNNSPSNSTIKNGSSFVLLNAEFAGLNFSAFMEDTILGTPFSFNWQRS